MKTLNIKGKEYVPVDERVRIFNEKYPEGAIKTEIIEQNSEYVLMKAIVIPDIAFPERIFIGHASEVKGSTLVNKTSHIENCETSCVGRALGMMSIGNVGSIASADEVLNATAYQKSQSQSDPSNYIRDQKRTYVGNYYLDKANQDKATAKKMLCKDTTFTNPEGKEMKGKTSIKELTEKQINMLYEKIKKEQEEKITTKLEDNVLKVEEEITM